MNNVKGYAVVVEETNELIALIEIDGDEVVEKDGYKVIPYSDDCPLNIEEQN